MGNFGQSPAQKGPHPLVDTGLSRDVPGSLTLLTEKQLKKEKPQQRKERQRETRDEYCLQSHDL